MGKFDALIPGLKKLPLEIRYISSGGVKYQEKVEGAKEEFTDRKASVLLAKYGELRAEADQKEIELKAASLKVEALAQLLSEVYEQEGITNLRVAGVGTFRTDFEPYSHVVEKNKYHEWLMENGFGPQLTLPWQTTNSVTKERLLSGEEAPPGVEVYLKVKPVFTREK